MENEYYKYYQAYGWNGKEWEVLGPAYGKLQRAKEVGMAELSCHSRFAQAGGKLIVVNSFILNHSKYEQENIIWKNYK